MATGRSNRHQCPISVGQRSRFHRGGRFGQWSHRPGDGEREFGYDVSVLLGNGDGTFQPQSRFGVGSSPAALVAAELSGDQRPDLAIADLGSNDISYSWAEGMAHSEDQLHEPRGNGPSGAVTADLNNDGHIDIITSNYYSNDISVLMGNGDGTFEAARYFAAGNGPTALAGW